MSDLFSLKNKTICVTGASSGLGLAIATYLHQQGASVISVARREDKLKQWADSVQSDRASYIVADLMQQENVIKLATQLNEQYDGVDVLINAAGINTREHADNVTQEGWHNTLTINLSTPFFIAQHLVPKMKAKSWGRIINFASLQSQRAFENGIAYGTSKGGVAQLTRAMAEAWSKYGVNVNAIAPGFFPTELTGPVFNNASLAKKNAEQTCIGRNGELKDIYGPIQFLCSPASDYVTGQLLYVDGGFTAK